MIEYRCFRNTDPPRLVEVWNQAFTGRGTVGLRTATPLERFVFAKTYFDPAGLIVAMGVSFPAVPATARIDEVVTVSISNPPAPAAADAMPAKLAAPGEGSAKFLSALALVGDGKL